MLNYYKEAKRASSTIGTHFGLRYLQQLCAASGLVLDVGCGEGTRLNTLLAPGQTGWGIDVSSQAIALAHNQYPHHHFQVADAQNLPFPDNHFDLVYSVFSLEHSSEPEKFVSEMIRVTRPFGRIVIICPNYGAPNRRSPVSTTNPAVKLIVGFVADFSPQPSLNWQRVKPKKIYDESDADTTVEPYLGSLISFISTMPCKVVKTSSLWQLERSDLNIRQRLFALLGKLSVFPFVHWGPQILLSLLKK